MIEASFFKFLFFKLNKRKLITIKKKQEHKNVLKTKVFQ